MIKKGIRSRNRVIAETANRLGLPGNTAHIEIGNAIAAHFGWDCKGKSAIKKFLKNDPKIEGITPYQKKERPLKNKIWIEANCDDFLSSFQWRKLRMEAIKKYGAKCQCCGASPRDGAVINVDHIKPRRRYPELSLDINNLQVLCETCNHGKGSWDETDWRPTSQQSLVNLVLGNYGK